MDSKWLAIDELGISRVSCNGKFIAKLLWKSLQNILLNQPTFYLFTPLLFEIRGISDLHIHVRKVLTAIRRS